MNKLFIFQKGALPKYLAELENAYSLFKDEKQVYSTDLSECEVDSLESIDVVISNKLPYKWEVIISSRKIVSIIIDRLDKRNNYTDIYIDHLYQGKDKYFVGENYSIRSERKQHLSFKGIFNLVSLLDWDSDFWGFPIAFLSSRHLTKNILYRVNKLLKNENVRLLQYLCNCHDNKSVQLAEENNYEFKDMRITYEKILEGETGVDIDSKIIFGEAEQKHIPELREISRDIYLDSRYYYDNNFESGKVCEFYMNWVEKAVKKEFDDKCFVLFINKIPIAYCTIKYHQSSEAKIGLVGVSNDHSGKGIGKILLNNVFNDLYSKGIKRVLVVTQGRNYPAQRLYQKVGFLTLSTELWYHKWLY